jgi:UDP-N-acetylglucosamine acyltransferase
MHVAKLQQNSNFVHPTAVIDPSVEMGENNVIGAYCVIGKNVVIGSNNRIDSYCSIGSAPEHTDFWRSEYKSVVIGDDCMIREHVTINSGTTANTILGNNVSCLRGCYVGHDCVLENNVTLSANALVGGHCYVCEGANLGLNVAVHQYSLIGHYAMLGMSAVVPKKKEIEPFNTYVGIPAHFLKKNAVAIRKNGFSPEAVKEFLEKYIELRKARRYGT